MGHWTYSWFSTDFFFVLTDDLGQGRATPQFAIVLHRTMGRAQHFTYRGSGLALGLLGCAPFEL